MSHPSRSPHCSPTEQCLYELRFRLRDSVTCGSQALGRDSDLKTLEKCSKKKKNMLYRWEFWLENDAIGLLICCHFQQWVWLIIRHTYTINLSSPSAELLLLCNWVRSADGEDRLNSSFFNDRTTLIADVFYQPERRMRGSLVVWWSLAVAKQSRAENWASVRLFVLVESQFVLMSIYILENEDYKLWL